MGLLDTRLLEDGESDGSMGVEPSSCAFSRPGGADMTDCNGAFEGAVSVAVAVLIARDLKGASRDVARVLIAPILAIC